ncbi:ATP-binding cassette domain-containing protein [bacterium]|nr:ATP-binding cassette domain-containing protein [bacterium]
MDSQPIITVSGLTKVYRSYDRREGLGGALLDLFKRRYRDVRAVDGVSFEIGRGEMVGYIGANGAGKSTTIKMLTGILTPTSGGISVNGLEPQRERYRHARQIGVVFGQRTQLWWDLAVIEAFHLLQKIYKVPSDLYRQRLDTFIEVLDISEQLHTPVRKLSLGQRMKCDLCASLLHKPPLLFLDEPTIGLDVAVKERIRRFIRYINREEGTTIILTTHDLTDIEELCPRIIIIDQGRVIYDGATEEIKDRFGRRRRVVLSFKRDYLPEYAGRPLPATEVPIAFAGPDPAKQDLAQILAAEEPQVDSLAPLGKVGHEEPGDGSETIETAVSETVNSLDEPGARQFMAELAAVMGDGTYLKVRRLNLRQYQLSFDRGKYTAGQVIGRLLEQFAVDDLELHEPELADIVRAIYEGRHQIPAR